MNDLNWLAQRYVLDEMDADEAAAFEVRLADDGEAAAAVAAAVRLIGSVKVSADDGGIERMTRVEKKAGRRVRVWLAPAMAAVMACVALVLIPMVAPQRPLRVSLDPAELVCRWNGFAMDSVVGRGPLAEVDRPAVDRLPQWLMAAVSIAGDAVAAEERN